MQEHYEIQNLNVSLIQENKRNSRKHSQKQINQVIRSIKEFGFTNPLLVDENHILIAGHCRLKAAKKLKYKTLPTVILKGLNEDQKRAYLIADNKLALNAEWDIDLLMEEVKELQSHNFDVELTGFTLEELADLTPEIIGPVEGEDDVPDLPKEAVTKLGDVWLLGKHRLMCGDSTSIDAINSLMEGNLADMVFTDPPYNTGMTASTQTGSGGLWKGKGDKSWLSHMFDDDFSDEEWKTFLSSFMTSYWMLMKEDSVAYICLDWRRNHELIPYIESSGFKRSNLIVWDKMVHGLGSDYKYTHEFINVCKKGSPKLSTHQGDDREYSDVWHIQRKMGKNDDHATAKPIELMERAIRHASKNNHLVVDLFGGSGSTLIACEKTNRRCFMMELMPSYCDVIVSRWENFTGKKAILDKSHD